VVDFAVHLGDYIHETVSEASFQQAWPITLPEWQDRARTWGLPLLYKKWLSDLNFKRVHEQFAFDSIPGMTNIRQIRTATETIDTDDRQTSDPQCRGGCNRAAGPSTPQREWLQRCCGSAQY